MIGRGHRFAVSECELYGVAEVGMLRVLACSSGQIIRIRELIKLTFRPLSGEFVVVRNRGDDTSEDNIGVFKLFEDTRVWDGWIDGHEKNCALLERVPMVAKRWSCWCRLSRILYTTAELRVTFERARVDTGKASSDTGHRSYR